MRRQFEEFQEAVRLKMEELRRFERK